MNFTVKIDKWARKTKGVEKGDSALLNDDGNSCCLGFCMLQLGASKEKLKGCGVPNDVQYKKLSSLKKFSYFLNINNNFNYGNNKLASAAIDINDDYDTSDKMKMYKLKRLFKKYGHEIEFV